MRKPPERDIRRLTAQLEYLRALLALVATASADDGHELREHLHPEIRGMVDREIDK